MKLKFQFAFLYERQSKKKERDIKLHTELAIRLESRMKAI